MIDWNLTAAAICLLLIGFIVGYVIYSAFLFFLRDRNADKSFAQIREEVERYRRRQMRGTK